MKKLLFLLTVIALPAFGQSLTNINNANAKLAVLSLSPECQQSLLDLTRAHNWAAKNLAGWTTYSTNAETLVVTTNNPVKKLHVVLADALANEKISRIIKGEADAKVAAIKAAREAAVTPTLQEVISDNSND